MENSSQTSGVYSVYIGMILARLRLFLAFSDVLIPFISDQQQKTSRTCLVTS